jgi:NAD(P)-dependent dehydrogenase (short-subunit alcohol dehydrogenase family)
LDFTNKVVLVTGASRGIGKVIAQQFATRGAQVVVHFNQNLDRAEKTLSSLNGSHHILLQADLTDPNAAQELVDTAVEKMGRIDVLVNNAGVYRLHRIAEVDYKDWLEIWQKTLATNLLAPANVTYWVAKQMVKQGGGKIVNVSSRGAFRGEPDAPAYGASKAGLNAMSQSLAKALAPHNIFIYVVAPGFVETDMARPVLMGKQGEEIRQQSPLNRLARSEEVARTVLFLASEGTDFLTGCIVDINGASYLRT